MLKPLNNRFCGSMAEQLIRNEQVVSSILTRSSKNHRSSRNHHDCGSFAIYGEGDNYDADFYASLSTAGSFNLSTAGEPAAFAKYVNAGNNFEGKIVNVRKCCCKRNPALDTPSDIT